MLFEAVGGEEVDAVDVGGEGWDAVVFWEMV